MGILAIHPRIHTAFTSLFIISIQYLFEMASKIKVEPEEVQPSTSGGGEQAEEQVKGAEGEESFDSDDIDDEFMTDYCEMANIIQPMTVSKELFYTDEMVREIMLDCPKLTKRDLIK